MKKLYINKDKFPFAILQGEDTSKKIKLRIKFGKVPHLNGVTQKNTLTEWRDRQTDKKKKMIFDFRISQDMTKLQSHFLDDLNEKKNLK